MSNLKNHFQYLLWAVQSAPTANRKCPFCQSDKTSLVKRKYLVTALYHCQECGLLFRFPKADPIKTTEFYQNDYSQGFTTDSPGDIELERLKTTRFSNSEKDYSTYIQVLRAAGVQPGQTILDFGCSWGYGSWQLSEAGYKVYSYEVSKPRAQYAVDKLGCVMVDDLTQIPEKVNCFFSAHVIEHLPVPAVFWEAAIQVLLPSGAIVAFTPNGELSREKHNSDYHHLWGEVHPILLMTSTLQFMAGRYGFEGNGYTNPYDWDAIEKHKPGNLDGEELLFIACRK